MSSAGTPSYKARKEAFVSNLAGSSLTDINLVTLIAPAAILLWIALQKRQSFFTPYNSLGFVVDFMLNAGAILFAFTAYSSAPIFLNVVLIAPAILLLLPLQSPSSNNEARKKQSQVSLAVQMTNYGPGGPVPNRPFLTNYRGAMLVATCVGILAVDFPIFPRRFAKVETWGASIMDLGVGSFVFSAGVVSARALLRPKSTSGAGTVLHQRLFATLRHSTPLLILGLIRLYSVKGLDYAEHVTEYGVHWNFFFTLALLPPFAELSNSAVAMTFGSYNVLAIILAFAYEIILHSTSLMQFILISPRGPSLLSKNREGVFSFIGYLAIFLAGRGTGMIVLPLQRHATVGAKSFDAVTFVYQERRSVLRNLAIQSVLYVVPLAFCLSYYTGNLQISRRLANAPYVFWIVAYNNAQIFLFGLIEHFGPRFVYWQATTGTSTSKKQPATQMDLDPEVATSRIMQAFNKNGLPVFLIANLLTGLVNLTLNTLDVGDAAAMGVLISYTAAVTAVATALDLTGLKIKM